MKTAEFGNIVETDSRTLASRPEDTSLTVTPVLSEPAAVWSRKEYRVAVLTPYDGGNLGDASIQDAMIENIRRRLPGVRLSGITLSHANFLKWHGLDSFPICETDRPFYRMIPDASKAYPGGDQRSIQPASQSTMPVRLMRKVLRRVPFLKTGVKYARAARKEMRHWIAGYRFVRNQDLVIVSGGGQLDEEWGGPWGHPFALFKWAVLARIARVPYVMASVGVCSVQTVTSRFLVSTALRLARYRSYRDKHSRNLAANLLRRASADPVVPDLAFGQSTSESQAFASIRSRAAGRPVIAISPIACGKPHNWPKSDLGLYRRYLDQLSLAMSVLLKRGCFLVLVFSSRGDDESVIPDMIDRLDEPAKKRIEQQTYVPQIATWRDFVGAVHNTDLVIASRLHSTILGFVAQRPTVAISFDPKVDWVMEDLGQTEYLLHIRDFTADGVIKAVDRLQLCRAEVTEKLARYQSQNAAALAMQYDWLAGLAAAHCQS